MPVALSLQPDLNLVKTMAIFPPMKRKVRLWDFFIKPIFLAKQWDEISGYKTETYV